MSMEWFDMDGNVISMEDWTALVTNDPDYKRVDQTTFDNGVWVSTVLLGLDMGFGSGPPIIFETMVFTSKDDMDELDMNRYSTKEEAQQGHKEMVAKWEGWNPGEDFPDE